MTGAARLLAVALGVVACAPLPVFGQSPAGAQPGRVELALGLTWIGRQSIGSGAATETTSSGGSLALFKTSTELAAVGGVDVRLGIRLTRAFELEASGKYAVPRLRTAISADFENAAPVTAAETVQQFMVGGGLLWYLRPIGAGRERVVPFLAAGGGYLRQLHEAAVLAETGHFVEAGGGLKVLLGGRDRTFLKAVGLRLDARAMTRMGGIAFDDRAHVAPELGAGVYVRF